VSSVRLDPIARDAADRSLTELSARPLADVLADALEVEQQRAKAAAPAPRARRARDQRVLESLASGFAPGATTAARERVLREVVEAYTAEIASRFDPRVYRAVAATGTRVFNWMAHAASGRGVRPWGLADLLPTRVAIEGSVQALQECVRQGTVVLAPTHQTHNDVPLFVHVLRRLGLPAFAWAAGLNLFRNPVLGAFLLRAGAYTVDRSRPSALYRSALEHYAARLLEAGRHTIVFPGGERSRSGAIEPRVRIGLLRAASRAQRAMRTRGQPHAAVHVIPVTVSWQYVLEAPWLVDEHLARCGVAVPRREAGPTWRQELRTSWRFFGHEDGATLRIGDPLDAALGPAELSRRLADAYYQNATALPSQVAARALFERVRRRHPEHDLSGLLALPPSQWQVSRREVLEEADALRQRLRALAGAGALHLATPLRDEAADAWLDLGLARLAELHGPVLVEASAAAIATRDLRLLYYYRNRLAGFGLASGAPVERRARGEAGEGGFLE
jgi:glycerol-3-phosphate O-acyltransferase